MEQADLHSQSLLVSDYDERFNRAPSVATSEMPAPGGLAAQVLQSKFGDLEQRVDQLQSLVLQFMFVSLLLAVGLAIALVLYLV